MTMTTRDWLQLLLLGGLWGASYFFVEIALVGFPVLALVSARIVLAALALWVFVIAARARIPREARVWVAFAVMGFLNNIIPFSLLTWGQVEITASLAAILTATTPMFTIIVAGLLLHDEPVTRSKVFAIALGFVGVVVMIGPDVLGELGRAAWAQLAILGASLSYAFAGAYGKRFHAWGVTPLVASAGQVSMSAAILVAVILATGNAGAFSHAGTPEWAAVAVLAVFCTAFAYLLFFRLLASAGATNVMLVTFIIPVSAILLGVTFLGEVLRPVEMLGMALIALGLVIIDGRLLRRFARRA